ncbi:hypothetical protein ACQEV9_18395 [Streptomyces chartreusis]|uniref:hypothetical protein n=1 Tax=Streptomyces chartreusis TaxID=1969 RepID=UPI003D924E3C
MATAEAAKGEGRVTVFTMFGPVFGYASVFADGRQTAYIGPVTPGVHWRKLWLMADRCCRPTDGEEQKARWIISQATRALTCGSGVVVKLPSTEWQMEAGGWRVDLPSEWSHQDALVTGPLDVLLLTPEQAAVKPTLYPHYAA